MDVEEIKRLKASSRRSALYSAIGMIILFGSLLYSYEQLRTLEQRRFDVQGQINKLTTEKNDLQETIDKLINQRETLEGPIERIAKPFVSASVIPNLTSSKGEKVYYFLLWIDLPEGRKAEIKRVEYHWNDPSHFSPVAESTEASNGYAVSYRGKECDPNLVIDLILQNKQAKTVPFSMCDAVRQLPPSEATVEK